MPDLHAIWEQLLNVAITGFDRQEIPAVAGDDAVGRLCARIADTERPAQFLNIAGTVALCRMAGALPVQESTPPPEPAAADAQQYCSAQAARLLRLALSDTHLTKVLPEWVAVMSRHHLLVPPELLTSVLPVMGNSSNLRELFLPIIGERGRWLARLHPDWCACVQLDSAATCREAWETGTRAERVAALRTLRALDPAGARALLDEVRASEPLDTLAALIPVLEVNLCSEDESLLESLLNDKRKTIRRPAADLLARLAHSAYQQRMVVRTGAWITITPAQAGSVFPPRLKQPVRCEVTLPDQFAPEWARDAVEETPPPGIGAKSWWLQQLVAAVPLAHWEATGACTAADLIAAVESSEHRQLLLHGWRIAAQRQRHIPWLLALLRFGDLTILRPSIAEVCAALSPAEREQLLLALLTERASHIQTIIPDVLHQLSDPWSEALSAQIIRYQLDPNRRDLFEPLAYYSHPRHLDACRKRLLLMLQDESPGACETRILSVLQFREDLYHTVEEGL